MNGYRWLVLYRSWGATMVVYELDSEQEYEAEASQCVGMTGYHHWFFLCAMAEALNLKFQAFAVDLHGERLGVVPLLFRRRGPVSTVNLLPIGCIGPLVRGEALRAGLVRELLKGVAPVLRRQWSVATRWAFSPGLNLNADQVALPGFEVSEWENFVMPANKSIDDCLKSMSRVRRQSIRQTEANGVFVEESSAEEIKKWLPEQIRIAYERQDLPPLYAPAEVRSLTERLAIHPRMLWRTAKATDGAVLGMTGCVIGDDRLWGWLMAGPTVPGISPQTLCYWDLIKWSVERGLAYDLGGVPNEGIRKLKVSLGAESETAISALEIRHKTAYKAGTALYEWGMNRLAKG
jgi:CelD/BcsL family acetyltransferase involved in cellulose biosynthesis